MLRNITLKEDTPGHAQFTASKWIGNNPEVEICVERNQGQERFFAGNNQWSTEAIWHKVSNLTIENSALKGILGPWIIDSLMAQVSSVNFVMYIRDSQHEDKCQVRLVGNIMGSAAAGDSSRTATVMEHTSKPEPITPAVKPESEPKQETLTIVEPETPDSVVTATTVDTITPEPEKRKSKGPLLLTLFLLLLLIAAALYYFLFMSKETDSKLPAEQKQEQVIEDGETVQSETLTTPEAVVEEPLAVINPCSLASSSGDDLSFIQSCLQSNPDTQQLLALIKEAKTNNQCNIAQRLYANQAQSGNVDIAIAYAREYEADSNCFSADKESAIYWYETALHYDADSELARQKLKELEAK